MAVAGESVQPAPVKLDEKQVGGDATPTGLKSANVEKVGNVFKVSGSEGADRITISDLRKDSDHVIKAGGGDDIFNFNASESQLPTNISTQVQTSSGATTTREGVNGIVDMGEGTDTVFLGSTISDYKFTLRSDGGIKIQYVGAEGDLRGVAVTFKNAEFFEFRNVVDQTDATGQVVSTNYKNTTFSYNDLLSELGYDVSHSDSAIVNPHTL